MKNKRKKHFLIVVSIIALIMLAVGVFAIYGNYQMSKIPGLSFDECLEYTLEGKDDAYITVGIIKDGAASYTVFSQDGVEMPQEEYVYEIGSLTKTFTAALIEKAIIEKKINLDHSIDKYLDLPAGEEYPTIEQLLTHTSGYKAHYFEKPMINNFFSRRNDFYGITDNMILSRLSKEFVTGEAHKFNYSNFGFAALGLILEEVYHMDYTDLVNGFAAEGLGLENTRISDKQGNLKRYWDWVSDDAYLAAGGLTSTISDMLVYAQYQLSNEEIFLRSHDSLATIDATTSTNEIIDINMDDIGAGWIIDRKNDIIWHNGGTGKFNCYLGFSTQNDTAVIILSNLAPNYKIPATVMGVKLLIECVEE